MWNSPAFAAVRKYVNKTRKGWRRKKVAELPKIDWLAELRSDPWSKCPPAPFRILSAELREAGNTKEADSVSSRGVILHPKNLWLAIEHAQVANFLENPEVRRTRWLRVLELAGDQAPTKVFKNLADTFLEIGDFKNAEDIALRGSALHPDDLALAERPAKIAFAAGFSAKAVQYWKDLVERYPEADTSWIYRRISEALVTEGLVDRARETLEEGMAKYPDNKLLQEAHVRMLFRCKTSSSDPSSAGTEPVVDFTAHLFSPIAEAFGRGTCSFPFSFSSQSRHLPSMLGYEKYIAPFRDPRLGNEIDVFVTWRSSSTGHQALAMESARALGKPHLCVGFGFIDPPKSDNPLTPQCSIIVCPDSMYSDATRPSSLETRLNSADYALSETEKERASRCISQIVTHRISRYDDPPHAGPQARSPGVGRKRVLLVDQRVADKTVEMGLAGETTFERMLGSARALPDHDIFLLLHRDAEAGPDASYLGKLTAGFQDPAITVIDFETNPYHLFDYIDKVYVCTSQIGFEALLAGKEVHCFGVPYYAGWGLTTDHVAIPRRLARRALEEIFHLSYIIHSRYFVPGKGVAELEDLIEYLLGDPQPEETPSEFPAELSSLSLESPVLSESQIPIALPQPVRILIIIPSGRLGASGRYIQNLAWSLQQIGCEVMVLAEGECPDIENGVQWRTLSFEGAGLRGSLRDEVVAFKPDIIYENGVRSRAQRVALELMALTGARLAMQSEDDDVQIYGSHHGADAEQALTVLDKARVTVDDLVTYLEKNDWNRSLSVLLDPQFDRWVEPLTRALCYRLASLHTAIWHPFEARLSQEYGVPTMVVPPVAAAADFERILPTPGERALLLARLGIQQDRVVIFIGGAIYGYSDEYALFLDALNQTPQAAGKVQLVISSSRSSLPVARMAKERLRPGIGVTDIGDADDESYIQILKACDVVCSPGVPDAFNRFRLPSRLVKAMAMGKPILTCRCGFGESLSHGINAFLMEGTDPADWAESIAMCLSEEQRELVGKEGLLFARQHFHSDLVAQRLKSKFDSLLASPARALADSIAPSVRRPIRTGSAKARNSSGMKFRNRYSTTMQDAIHRIAVSRAQLGLVVHLGAGRGNEVEDYCRLGANRIVLVDALDEQVTELRKFENIEGSVIVKQAAISGNGGHQPGVIVTSDHHFRDLHEGLWLSRPDRLLELFPSLRVQREYLVETTTISDICSDIDLSGSNNLLVLELNGNEATALAATPDLLLKKFRWIALRSSSLPLCEGGTTSETIQGILMEAEFTRIEIHPNHAESLQTQLFENQKK